MGRRIYDSEQVTVTTVPVEHARSDERTACLIVLSGANVGRVYQLGEIVTIGRETSANIQLLDDGISRRHAMLRRTSGGQYELLDVGSRNGTYANAQLLDSPVMLADGDKVQVGAQTVLKFSFTDALETSYAQKMYDVALRDGLTGLFNRRYFDQRLDSELAYSKRHTKPLALLMARKGQGYDATVTVVHSRTPNMAEVCREADILIAAIGRPEMLTTDFVKPGAVVIDVGMNRVEDATRKRGYRLCGDVDFPNVKETASAITPVPGGVGPMTIAMLMSNTLQAARRAAGEDA